MKILPTSVLLMALMPAIVVLAIHNLDPSPVADPHPRPGTPDRPSTMAYPPVLYVDNETGCHYLATDSAQVLVPRMDRDGNQVCGSIARATEAAINSK